MAQPKDGQGFGGPIDLTRSGSRPEKVAYNAQREASILRDYEYVAGKWKKLEKKLISLFELKAKNQWNTEYILQTVRFQLLMEEISKSFKSLDIDEVWHTAIGSDIDGPVENSGGEADEDEDGDGDQTDAEMSNLDNNNNRAQPVPESYESKTAPFRGLEDGETANNNNNNRNNNNNGNNKKKQKEVALEDVLPGGVVLNLLTPSDEETNTK